MTLEERVDALASRPEFQGDREALRRGLAEQGTAGDPLLRVGFRPFDRASFERTAAAILGPLGARVEVKGTAQDLQPRTVALYKNLPGGVAHVPYSVFWALLEAGLVASFSWAPEIALSSAATPLSVIGDLGQEQRLRAAGVTSALDLVSKGADPRLRLELASAAGLEPEALDSLVAKARDHLTPDEKARLETRPPLPFVPGIPRHRPR